MTEFLKPDGGSPAFGLVCARLFKSSLRLWYNSVIMKQTERVAVVTGANRGLGLETCRQLAQQGYRVILTSRDEGKGQKAAKGLEAAGLSVLYHQLDVQNDVSVASLREYVMREFGRLDVLVNNAAVNLAVGRGVLDIEMEVYIVTMDANLFGPLRLCKAFVPLMLEQDYGRVVNVSSDAGQLSGMTSYAPPYGISKTALSALTVHVANAARGKRRARQRGPSGLGADRYGRTLCAAFARGGRGYHHLAG